MLTQSTVRYNSTDNKKSAVKNILIANRHFFITCVVYCLLAVNQTYVTPFCVVACRLMHTALMDYQNVKIDAYYFFYTNL